MPNQTIYLNAIQKLEKEVGISLLDSKEVAKKLQDAWRNDNSQGKVDYLDAYREVFRGVLAKLSDRAISIAFQARADEKADLKTCLLKAETTLKICAMALIPELRENEDVLSNMTFGMMTPARLKMEFSTARAKYLTPKAAKEAMPKAKETVYNKYKSEWQLSTVRKITELVWDKTALDLMSREQKIEYAVALDAYRNDPTLVPPLGEQNKTLIDDALNRWKQELGVAKEDPMEDLITNQYYQYAETLGESEWIDVEINAAIAEYNKTPTPAKQEVAHYKEVENIVKEWEHLHKEKEGVIKNDLTDDAVEMAGELFQQEELAYDLKEAPTHREREFLTGKVDAFNKEYSLRVNREKLSSTVEQLSKLMVQAREEKEQFLSKDNVVLIENGEEKCLTAKEYYKESIDKANKEFMEKLVTLEEERTQAEKEYNEMLGKLERNKDSVGEIASQKVKEDAQNILNGKNADINQRIEAEKKALQEELDKFKGGIVIEKSGNDTKEYKSSRYYETHETKNEQYAYGQYQLAFSKVYKDACKNVKEQNYADGKETNFAKIANDVDRLFKSAMYLSNVYDNEKNAEIIQKCSFGAYSAEQLASFVSNFENDSWARNQSDEQLWAKQSSKAKNILSQWAKEEVSSPKVKPADRIKNALDEKRAKFVKGDITKKEMLDYMAAAQAHIMDKYPTAGKKFFNLIQYNREKNALNECRKAMGLSENASLRIAINQEYERVAKRMSKEEVFKSIRVRMNNAPNFKLEKRELEQEHQIVQDRVVAEKTAKLDGLKAKDKEPISIPELDERKAIINAMPRVPKINMVAEAKKDLKLGQ